MNSPTHPLKCPNGEVQVVVITAAPASKARERLFLVQLKMGVVVVTTAPAAGVKRAVGTVNDSRSSSVVTAAPAEVELSAGCGQSPNLTSSIMMLSWAEP